MEKLLNFLQTVGNLKLVKRRGWVLRKVPNPESVAEHSFRTAILAMVFADKFDVDKKKLLEMALVHDLAEAITGDLTPMELVDEGRRRELKRETEKMNSGEIRARDFGKYWEKLMNETKEKKSDLERKAMLELSSKLENGKELLELWEDYEERKSKEAMIVKQLETIEMILQAIEYEKLHAYNGTLLDDFWPNAKSQIKDKRLLEFFEFLTREEKKIRKKHEKREKV